MEIRGPNNSERSSLDRTTDSRKAGRQKQAGGSKGSEKSPGALSGFDSIETSTSDLIGESVAEIIAAMDQRASEIGSRREELLSLADDPAAVRRAARGILSAQGGLKSESI